MKKLVFLFAILLTACDNVGFVTSEHIEHAQFLCANNGGLGSISDPSKKVEVESCGYKCWQKTGRTLYLADVRCNNGASFGMRYSK